MRAKKPRRRVDAGDEARGNSKFVCAAKINSDGRPESPLGVFGLLFLGGDLFRDGSRDIREI